MLPSSHLAPMNLVAINSPRRDQELAEAFAGFVCAAQRLETSYGALQSEIAQLRLQLEERDAQLASSLAETLQIRAGLQSILEALPCGVALVSDRDQLLFANPEAYRIVGQSPESPAAERDATLHAFIRGMGPAARIAEDEREVCVDSPRCQWAAVRCGRMRLSFFPGSQDCAGEGTIYFLRDITWRRRSEQERDQGRNMVALAEMAAMLAHEIRNPLGAMELFAGLLTQSPELTDEPRGWARNIQAAIRSLSMLVDNVLTLKTVGAFQRTLVRVEELIAGCISFLTPLADQCGIAMVFDSDSETATISADANSFRQLVLNLSNNAFKHTPSGGRLTIKVANAVAAGRPIVAIEFADTGSGIAPELLPHIFEPGATTGAHSTGLGLTICRKIMDGHQGKIAVASLPGHGSTIRLEFPAL